MLRQGDVLKWFKQLQGDERIELMCCLFDCCLPLEIRFLATYVEFLANKHYQFLKKWEAIANTISLETLSHTDLSNPEDRRTLCAYLALMYSHNNLASTKFFEVLLSFLNDRPCTPPGQNNNSDTKLKTSDWNEVRLLLTMACYHPAFKFNDQQRLLSKLNETSSKMTRKNSAKRGCDGDIADEQLTENLNGDLQFEKHPGKSSSDVDAQDEDTQILSPGRLALNLPGGMPDAPALRTVCATEPHLLSTAPPPSASSVAYTSLSSPQIPSAPRPTTTPPPMGIVFPNSVGMVSNMGGVIIPSGMEAKSPINNPLLPGNNGVVPQFYQCTNQLYGPRGSYPLHSSSAPIPVQTSRQSFHPNYSNLHSSYNPSAPTAFTFGSSPTFASPLQSPFTSPLPSPKNSPRPSPAQSPMFGRKLGDTNTQRKYQQLSSVFEWLKSLRLHKYVDVFSDYSFEKLSIMTEEELTALGLTQGARKKLRLNIDALCERGISTFGPNHLLDRKVPVQPEPNMPTDRQRVLPQANLSSSSMSNNNVMVSPRGTPVPGMVPQGVPNHALMVPLGSSLPASTVPATQIQMGKPMEDYYNNPKVIVLQSPPSSDRIFYQQPGPFNNAPQLSVVTSNSQMFQRDMFSPGLANAAEAKQHDVTPLLYRLSMSHVNRSVSCYNCGATTHAGEDCGAATIEAEAHGRYGFNINYESRAGDNKTS